MAPETRPSMESEMSFDRQTSGATIGKKSFVSFSTVGDTLDHATVMQTTEELLDTVDHGFLTDEDYKEAKEHLKSKLPGGGETSIVGMHIDEFSAWGIGVQLYFQFTYWFMKLAFVLALLYFPQYVWNMSGNSLDVADKSGANMLNLVLAAGTIPNLGLLYEKTDCVGTNCSRTAVNTSLVNETAVEAGVNLLADYDRLVDVVGTKKDAKEVTFGLGVLDAIASLLILCMCWWFERIHIPNTVESHRTEFVTPEIYTVFVDCLPRRNFGSGGMEAYADRLKSHFELLLAAQVTQKGAFKGQKVISTADEGHEVRDRKHWLGWKRCPLRKDGYDHRGRRLGKIHKIGGSSCYVIWEKTALDPDPLPTKCRLSNGENHGELRDAYLLYHLEINKMKPYQPSAKKDDTENCCVYSVSLMRDFEEHLDEMKAKSKEDDRTLEVKLRALKQANRRSSRHSHHFGGFGTASHDLHDMDLELDVDIKLEERCVVAAFVIFNHKCHRDFIFSEYRFSRTIFRTLFRNSRLSFNSKAIRVDDAQSPCDVFWDNLDYPVAFRLKRKFQVGLACFSMIIAVIFIVSLAKDKAKVVKQEQLKVCEGLATDHVYCECKAVGLSSVLNDNPPGINERCSDWVSGKIEVAIYSGISSLAAIVANLGGGFIVTHLAALEKPRTITEMNRSVMMMTTVVFVICLGPIRTVVNAKLGSDDSLFRQALPFLGNGEYKDLSPGWYINVGTSLATTLIINAGFPIVAMFQAPLFYGWVKYRKKKQKLMSDLLDLHTPPEFTFALRHAEQEAHLFATLLYCAGMPVLVLILPISMALYYWVDKYTFLRASLIPPRYTESCMVRHVQFIEFAVLMHSFFSVYTYANAESAPSECIFCNEDDRILGINVGTPDPLRARSAVDCFVSKMLVRSSMPCAFVGSLVLMSYVFKLLEFVVGNDTMRAFWDRTDEDDIDGIDHEESYHNEKPSMERRGIETNYNIEEVPGYEFLVKKDVDAATGMGHYLEKINAELDVAGMATIRPTQKEPEESSEKKKPAVVADEFKADNKVASLAEESKLESNESKAAICKKMGLAARAKAKAKSREGKTGKGKGKGKRKNFADAEKQMKKTGHDDDLLDVHHMDLQAARKRLGLLKGAAHSKQTLHKLQDLDQEDPKGKGKGKGKGKSKSAPPALIGSSESGLSFDSSADNDLV